MSTLSALAIFAATTTTQAFAPPTMNLGLLRPLEKWKVGTVKMQDTAYCAMMNQFDKDVALAFARNPDGYGSIAVNFRESFFKPGEDYDITMQVDDAHPRHFTGRASSARAVIVQIGRDENFYDALNGDGNLSIGLPTMDMIFALRKFSGTYVALVDCANRLQRVGPKTVAMPVPDVEKSALDRQANSEAENSRLEDLSRQQKLLMGQLEQQKQKVAELEQRHAQQQAAAVSPPEPVAAAKPAPSPESEAIALENKALRAELAAKQARLAALAKQKTTPVKKASVPAPTVARAAAPVPVAKIAAPVVSVAAPPPKPEILWTPPAVAAAVSVPAKAVEKTATAIPAPALAPAPDTGAPQRERDSLQAQVKVLQDRLAEATQQHTQSTDTLTQKLTATDADYQAKLAAARAGQDALKKQLDAVTAENLALHAAKDGLSVATQQTEAQDKKIKKLQATLGAKEQ